MKIPLPLLVATWILLTCAGKAAALFPFVLPWDDSDPGTPNVSSWIDKPAGASGFVTTRDAHLFAGEKRIRFFGVNFAFGANFPTHADAEKVAARMAKFGINCVRFHHMDTGFSPRGLLKADGLTLDPEMLERMDYLIAQLKKNGIYADLNLHVGRVYPGFTKTTDTPKYFKAVDNFYPPMIAQQHDYARALLTHVNPYTGATYANEPAVAFIEINNENGLIDKWYSGALDKMPDPYAADLRRQWNQWLAEKYGDNSKLATAWKQGEVPPGTEMIDAKWDGTKAGWQFERHGGAEASLQVFEEKVDLQSPEFAKAHAGQEFVSAAKITVSKPGTEDWHLQLCFPSLKIEAGTTYTLSFFAKSKEPHAIRASITQGHAPWKGDWSIGVPLASEWQRFSFSFHAREADTNMRLSFAGLGGIGCETSITDVSLRQGAVEAFHNGENPGNVDFFKKKDLALRTSAAEHDWYQFLYDTEDRYWTGMMTFIRNELKARSLVVGTAAGYSPWSIQAHLDVVDAHAYWQHPHFPHKEWDLDDWVIKNIPMAGAPDGGALPGLAMMRVAGKPFIVTEYNHPAPNTYSSEAFLELCAVAALQDWDGVFVFDYSGRNDQWNGEHIANFFDVDQHPTKMATLPAAVALFLRGDVTPPERRNIVETTPDGDMETIRTQGPRADARAYGFSASETFEHPVAIRIGSVEKRPQTAEKKTTVTISDNNELTWDTDSHRMLINTPRSAGVIGSVRAGERIGLGGVTITPGPTIQNWATITVTVMEGGDFKTAKKLLITATGDTENTDLHWKDAAKTSTGRDPGKAPSLVEGVPATISLPLNGNFKAWALDEHGGRKREVPLKKGNNGLEIELSPEQKTLWWEVGL